jgi:hypothetical protein
MAGAAQGGLTVQWPVRQPSERPQSCSGMGPGNGSLAGGGSERASERLGINVLCRKQSTCQLNSQVL